LAGWVLVWTSLSPDVLDADAVMSLYRSRWQVELAIKRWKSILDADALRARYGSPLAERPMRHQLQRLPEAVCQLLYWCDPREEQCCEPLWEERKAP
jgi:ABC-type protease/lipase transport system fused ATPase/permease subunit